MEGKKLTLFELVMNMLEPHVREVPFRKLLSKPGEAKPYGWEYERIISSRLEEDEVFGCRYLTIIEGRDNVTVEFRPYKKCPTSITVAGRNGKSPSCWGVIVERDPACDVYDEEGDEDSDIERCATYEDYLDMHRLLSEDEKPDRPLLLEEWQLLKRFHDREGLSQEEALELIAELFQFVRDPDRLRKKTEAASSLGALPPALRIVDASHLHTTRKFFR